MHAFCAAPFGSVASLFPIIFKINDSLTLIAFNNPPFFAWLQFMINQQMVQQQAFFNSLTPTQSTVKTSSTATTFTPTSYTSNGGVEQQTVSMIFLASCESGSIKVKNNEGHNLNMLSLFVFTVTSLFIA